MAEARRLVLLATVVPVAGLDPKVRIGVLERQDKAITAAFPGLESTLAVAAAEQEP